MYTIRFSLKSNEGNMDWTYEKSKNAYCNDVYDLHLSQLTRLRMHSPLQA